MDLKSIQYDLMCKKAFNDSNKNATVIYFNRHAVKSILTNLSQVLEWYLGFYEPFWYLAKTQIDF